MYHPECNRNRAVRPFRQEAKRSNSAVCFPPLSRIIDLSVPSSHYTKGYWTLLCLSRSVKVPNEPSTESCSREPIRDRWTNHCCEIIVLGTARLQHGFDSDT